MMGRVASTTCKASAMQIPALSNHGLVHETRTSTDKRSPSRGRPSAPSKFEGTEGIVHVDSRLEPHTNRHQECTRESETI